MHQNFGEGLRHARMMRETWRGFNPAERVDFSAASPNNPKVIESFSPALARQRLP
jgi:hypothetical protein